MFAELRPYMFTRERVAPPSAPRYTCARVKTAPLRMNRESTQSAQDRPAFFCPGGRDPLFWCFQIGRGACTDLDLAEARGFQREQELKAEAVERLREIENAKTPAAQRRLAAAEAELCARPFTRGHGLAALAKAYQLKLLYVSGGTCCEFGPSEGPFAAVVRRVGSRNSRRHEVLYGDQADDEARKMLAELWCLETWLKPIRAVGAYSLSALRDMAKRAGLCIEGADERPLKKDELHSALRALAQQN
jgi:hypothetical protein